jgi:pyrimidine operon attenuation protein/uracil phosphoribosyltransferase
MQFKATLMDKDAVMRTLRRISHEIIEKNKGCENLCLVGILRRGVPLAEIIAENIKMFENVDVNVGVLDISLYRDDISELGDQAKVNATKIDFDINGKKIVLVDDVLFTGRTVRAAMDALISIGRPSKIQLAVLVDRGHRELPICANFTGKNLPTSHTEMIKVSVDKFDNKTQVDLYDSLK